MKYSVSEILDNTSGYIFYQNPKFDQNKLYELCAVSKQLTNLDDTIFIPIYLVINAAPVDTFLVLERYIKSGVRAFMFDENHFLKNDSLIDLINRNRANIDLVIMVPDTVKAVCDMANYTRINKISKKTKYIAITGSIGKTSTTEMLYGILKQHNSVYRGEAGANVKFRIAHKFLEVEPNIDYFLFECSGQGRGYLKYFSELIMPDIAVITKISNENLGEYLTLKNLANEKSTLLTAMSEDTAAIINGDNLLREATKDYICKKVYIDDGDYTLIKSDKEGSEFIYDDEKYFIPVTGLHQINNAIKVIEAAMALGFSTNDIRSGLLAYEPVGNRWVVDKFKNDAILITDCPNNPSYDTLIANIKSFLELYKDAPYKRLVITRIKALGVYEQQTYLKIAKYISTLPIEELVCVGSEITSIYEYVKSHSNIKTMYFEKPTTINENDKFVSYLINTMNFPQATLLKGQRKDGTIGYGDVKDVLRRILK